MKFPQKVFIKVASDDKDKTATWMELYESLDEAMELAPLGKATSVAVYSLVHVRKFKSRVEEVKP